MARRREADRYRITLISNGVRFDFDQIPHTEYRQVKASAIGLLKDELDRNYGRGEHTVMITELSWRNVTTPERDQAGLSDFAWVPGDVVFTL